MSARWFRFYAEAMRSPKVLQLTDREFRLWVQMLAIAAENDGFIPPADNLKRLLKARLDHLLTGVKRLLSVGLIDALEDGYEPHNWRNWQDDHRPPAHEWREIRTRIFARDDYTCSYCGSRDVALECDHVHPVALGGGHDDGNLTTACRPCNRSKRAKPLSEWMH